MSRPIVLSLFAFTAAHAFAAEYPAKPVRIMSEALAGSRTRRDRELRGYAGGGAQTCS
jgi:hypothetical protein